MKKLLTLTLSLMLGITAFAQGQFPMFNNRTHTAEAQPFANLSPQIWDLTKAFAWCRPANSGRHPTRKVSER